MFVAEGSSQLVNDVAGEGREETIVRLLGKAAMPYGRSMIAVEADQDCVQIRIPTNGLTPEEVNGLVSWLRVEAIVCRSRLTPEAAWQLAEEIKSDWWRDNEKRFLPPGSE